ncbi:hypothetical protein TNIN_330331, partial [Trichonephila inaurata madagascariensis]
VIAFAVAWTRSSPADRGCVATVFAVVYAQTINQFLQRLRNHNHKCCILEYFNTFEVFK